MKRSKTRATQTTDLQHDRLLGLYERVLTTIRDLDEDYSTGKMPEESYRQEREIWSQRGVEVLQALDEHGSKTTVPAKNGPSRDSTLEQIDREFDNILESAAVEHAANAHPSTRVF
jgi:hypothetical protein